jgi:D-3-phosphoglycerate dehydrogenase
MARWLVLVGSRSFGKAAPEHLTRLEEAGCEVIPNQAGRAYRADELLDALRGVDAIITGTDELTAGVIRSADRLKTIAKHGVGLDNVDLEAANEHGVVVTAAPGAIHDSVADLTLALLLALARDVVGGHLSVESGGWKGSTGTELRGKVMGIVGLGRIGREVCHRARAFGMSVVARDPFPDEEFAAAHGVEFLSLDDLLRCADVISLHAGAAGDGRPLVGAPELESMKPTAFLINTARGRLVDEQALATALRGGRLAGAGLDVFEREPPEGSPLLGLENVVFTPHVAGRTKEGLVRMGEITLENCLLALRGEEPRNRVPLPGDGG